MRALGEQPHRAPEDPARARIEAAMVELVAERGYQAAEPGAVCELAGVAREEFDRRFASQEECFLALHAELSAELCRRIEAAYGEPPAWHDRIWAAAMEAVRFLQADPKAARFLVLGPNGAGEGALERRDRLLDHLADMLDGGREEHAGPGPLSRASAEIAAAAIFTTLAGKVQSGCVERREHFLPELVYLATLPYLGAEAAEQELQVQSLLR